MVAFGTAVAKVRVTVDELVACTPQMTMFPELSITITATSVVLKVWLNVKDVSAPLPVMVPAALLTTRLIVALLWRVL